MIHYTDSVTTWYCIREYLVIFFHTWDTLTFHQKREKRQTCLPYMRYTHFPSKAINMTNISSIYSHNGNSGMISTRTLFLFINRQRDADQLPCRHTTAPDRWHDPPLYFNGVMIWWFITLTVLQRDTVLENIYSRQFQKYRSFDFWRRTRFFPLFGSFDAHRYRS